MARNLSDYWRVDKCRDRIGELASVLEGSQKAVELLEGRFKVVWSGQHATSHSRKTITLDPGILQDLKPPYPGEAVDVVIGAALHEAGHEKWTLPMTNNWETWEDLTLSEQHDPHCGAGLCDQISWEQVNEVLHEVSAIAEENAKGKAVLRGESRRPEFAQFVAQSLKRLSKMFGAGYHQNTGRKGGGDGG